MKKWHELIVENEEALAELLTLENGKTLKEAKAEIFQCTILTVSEILMRG